MCADMLHGRVVRPPAFGAKLEMSTSAPLLASPAWSKSSVKGIFLELSRSQRMGGDQGVAATQSDLVKMGKAA